jgi:segregation and condensation protein A
MSASSDHPSLGSDPDARAFDPVAESSASCSVRLAVFEGPLDLLLHLIRQNELEITDLPIARVAEQYLEYLELMRDLRLDVAAEYLVMAATLAWIKSRLLLPSDEVTEEEEALDPRAELVARLLEYQRFKEAAEDLGQRSLLGRDVFKPPAAAPELPPEDEREIEVGLVQLIDALRQVLREAKDVEAIHQVLAEPVTVRERMVVIIDALEQAETVELMDLVRPQDGGSPTRAFIVATFLAILELARMATLRIFQSLGDDGAPQGPIRLRRAVPVGETSSLQPA